LLQKEKDNSEKLFTRLNPLNDYLFKQYMGTDECKICLQSFLSAVLDTDITDVEIVENKELSSDTIEGKFGLLDVRAKRLDGTQINIEVQLCNEGNMVERTLFYNCKLYVEGIKKGEDYIDLKKVITINILNFNYLPYQEFHISSHHRIDQHPEELLTEKSEIHFIELKKFYTSGVYDIHNSLHRWLKYFDQNINEYELKELVEMDHAIAAAEDKTKQVAASEEDLRYYEALEAARRDRNSALNYAKNQGIVEGELKGITKGELKGKAEGELIGIAKGELKGKAEGELIGIAKGELKGKVKGADEEAVRFATLAQLLLKDKRQEDLIRVSQNPDLRKRFYQEFNIE